MEFLNDYLFELADAPSTPPLGLSQSLDNSVCHELLSLETAWHFRLWKSRAQPFGPGCTNLLATQQKRSSSRLC